MYNDSSFAEGYAIGRDSGNGGYGNNAFGGDWAWWIVILLIFGWGNGGWGFGDNGGGAMRGALTREQACIDNNFQNLMRETAGISDAVNLGFANLNSTICNQQYDTAQMINSMNIANLQSANALQSQIASCCCDLREAVTGVNYNLATQSCDTRNTIQNTTRDIIDNQNANARAILDKLTSQEIAAKDAQISALNNQLFRADLAASQVAQNQYLVNELRPCPVPAFITCNPYTASYGIGLTNSGYGCGCGTTIQ